MGATDLDTMHVLNLIVVSSFVLYTSALDITNEDQIVPELAPEVFAQEARGAQGSPDGVHDIDFPRTPSDCGALTKEINVEGLWAYDSCTGCQGGFFGIPVGGYLAYMEPCRLVSKLQYNSEHKGDLRLQGRVIRGPRNLPAHCVYQMMTQSANHSISPVGIIYERCLNSNGTHLELHMGFPGAPSYDVMCHFVRPSYDENSDVSYSEADKLVDAQAAREGYEPNEPTSTQHHIFGRFDTVIEPQYLSSRLNGTYHLECSSHINSVSSMFLQF